MTGSEKMKDIVILNEIIKSDKIPFQLKNVLRNLRNEDAANAADEIIACAEELLIFISALIFSVYLHSDRQSDDHNQFLLELFTGHIKPGSRAMFFRACRMLKSADRSGSLSEKILTAKGTPRKSLTELSGIRNKVLHGLFVLPSEYNIRYTKRLCNVINDLFADDLLTLTMTRRALPGKIYL